MKILMIIVRFFPAIGGGERHVFLLSKELQKNGNETTIYTTTSLSSADIFSLNDLFKKGKKKTSLLRNENIEDIKIKRFDIILRLWSFVWIPSLTQQIKKDIKKFDIIHAHGYHVFTSIIGCYYAKKFNKPFILTAHDLIIPNNLPVIAKLFKNIYDIIFGRYLLKNSNRLIALTRDQIDQYILRSGNIELIRLIPNGIPLDTYIYNNDQKNDIINLNLKNEDKILLFVGRMEEYKGIQDVLDIMPKILEEFSLVKFIIVGKDYGYKEELEKLARDLYIEDKVIFAENITENELIEIYKRADIFVFPSKMEGFGLVILEAMALGTLCMAYPIPSVRNIIKNKENGILVADKFELLDNILYYLKNPDEKKRIEKKALEYVKTYDIKNVSKSIENVYMEVINENMFSM